MAGKYYKEPIIVKSYTKTANTSGGFTQGTLTDKYTTIATIKERSIRRTNEDDSESFVSGFSVEFFNNPDVTISVGDVIIYNSNTLIINRLKTDDRKLKYIIEATAKT